MEEYLIRLILIREICRLYQDYLKCTDELIKHLIYQEILALIAAANQMDTKSNKPELV